MPDRGKLRRHFLPVPVETRPVEVLVNIHSSHNLRILYQRCSASHAKKEFLGHDSHRCTGVETQVCNHLLREPEC